MTRKLLRIALPVLCMALALFILMKKFAPIARRNSTQLPKPPNAPLPLGKLSDNERREVV